jgi:hypothetical protein
LPGKCVRCSSSGRAAVGVDHPWHEGRILLVAGEANVRAVDSREFDNIISHLRKMSRSLIKYGQLPEKGTAFFLCDIQEKFRPALSHFEQIVEAAKKLV